MKVLQITAFSGWGCTGRIAAGIHRALTEAGHESCIAWGRVNTAENIPNIKIGNRLDQNLHGLYTRITDKCGFGSKQTTRQFIKKIDEYDPDIIQLHIIHGYYINLEELFNYLKEKEKPVVWTFHDCWAYTGHCPYFDVVGCDKWKTGCNHCIQRRHHPKSWLIDNSQWNWNKKKKLFTGISNLTIVTPSKWLKKLVKQSFFNSCNVEVINNGIDTETFKPTESSKRDTLKVGNRKMILGVSSTWSENKGLKDFTQLSKILSEEYVIVLVGLSNKQIKTLPDNIIGITRTDNVRELAELYSIADVFVNPTYEDNYPTTNLEAISCGTPVVTYETGGSVESVLESGCGCIVPQGDVERLAKTIQEIANKKSGFLMNGNFECDERIKYREYVNLYMDILVKKSL